MGKVIAIKEMTVMLLFRLQMTTSTKTEVSRDPGRPLLVLCSYGGDGD